MIIIGITGTLAAGKGTIVDYLVKRKWFNHFSARSYLNEELKKRGIESNRDTLVALANELREKYGASHIAEKLHEMAAASNGNCIIESIRTLGEVDALTAKWDFTLFAIDADPKIRYDRAYSRGSETDHIDFETFLANEAREMESTDPNKQNLSACIARAHYVFKNDGSVDELEKQIDATLQTMGYKKPVPSWDEYFIEIAKVTAKRSKDPSTQTGCVIVDKNNRPISFGYNGFIGGADESFFTWERPMKYHFVIHAEMNALIFAKRDLTGSKIYTKYFPCENCLKHILQSGISEIVYEHAFVESKKSWVVNSMNTNDTTEAVKNMLRAMPQVITRNSLTGKSYIEEVAA